MTVRARTRERRNTTSVLAMKQSTELEKAARLAPPPDLHRRGSYLNQYIASYVDYTSFG